MSRQDRKREYLREWRRQKKLAEQVLSVIEQALDDDEADTNNPFQKFKKDDEESSGLAMEMSSEDGKIMHYHELERDESGKVTGHGEASEGPAHKHPIEEGRLGPAGDSDPDDPEHTHSFDKVRED